ncbi:MAG: PAS domain S-box protein, partial [Caulobacterales bacterium]|nr:PAS domain S-box protein [Caulobacterales bacterium]
MGALHSHAVDTPRSLSLSQLERRLERERRARATAEELLESKSRELYVASQALRVSAASLESQRIQLNTILEHTLAAIFLAREDLTIKQANRAGLTMFGINEEYYADIVMSDLFAGPPQARAWIERRLKAGERPDESHREAVGRRGDGAEFPIEFAVTAIEHDGKRHSVWMIRDITRRKSQELERAKLERELAQVQKFEALGTLSSGIAHEINTPVQYVSDNVRFLKDTFSELIDVIRACQGVIGESDTPAAQAARDTIAAVDLDFLIEDAPSAIDQSLDGLDQVARIVQAIKSFAHPGGDEKAPTDINQIVDTTATVARNQWKYIAHLKTDLASDLPPVPCHASDVNQVVLNLIVNAADAI